MRNIHFPPMLQLLARPICQICLGLVLISSPDTFSALFSTILGWCALIVGILIGIDVLTRPSRELSTALICVALVLLGGWLLRDPLALSANLGRLVGIVLMVSGFKEVRESRSGKVLGLLVLIAGIALIFTPMSVSRIVFRLIGAFVLFTGAAELIARLRRNSQPPKDNTIIDAL